MKKEWKTFWKHLAKHLWLMPLGMVIALAFYLLSLPELRRSGEMLTGLIITGIYGLTIPVSVAICFIAAYAARLQFSLKTGRELKVTLPINILVNLLGLAIGVRLAMWENWIIFDRQATGEKFLSSMIFGGIVIVVFGFYLAYKQAKAEALALRAEAAEARYHILETQMRPHFLFNALNSLAELIESNQENAAETTYKLSDLYRQILKNSGLKTAPLNSELEIIRSYLELEQLRFGSRLQFHIEQPENSDEIFLPTLTLQTLVENAVKHGVSPSIEGGRIVIEIDRLIDKRYSLRVMNTGSGYRPQSSNNGTGLANTRARLELLYGKNHKFRVESDDFGRTVASFEFSGEKID